MLTLEPPVAVPLSAVQVSLMLVLLDAATVNDTGSITRGVVSIVAPAVLISDGSPHPSALCAETLT